MKKLLLIIGDITTFYFSLFTMLVLRYRANINDDAVLAIHVAPFSILFIIWISVFYIAHLYEIEHQKNNEQFFSNLTKIFVGLSTFSVLFFYFAPFFQIAPKINLLIFLAIEFVLITIWRLIYNNILVSRSSKNKVLIIGNKASELVAIINDNQQLGFKIVDVINIENFESSSDIVKAIKHKKTNTVVISPEIFKQREIINALFSLLGSNIRFVKLADFTEQVTGKIPLESIDQVWFLENISGDNSRLYDLSKRIVDISASIIGLILASPLLLIATVGTKLSSPGPIFYRQQRTGRNGKIFELIKFRTMPHDIESKTGAVWASTGDNRATYFGKFLRKTRIDELPQIINVLKGELSFVGPRPERPEFHQKLVDAIPFYDKRYLVTPGLTGWAQIKHKLDFDGGMTIKDTEEKVRHDLYYIKNRSIIMDISILLKTIHILLRKVL